MDHGEKRMTTSNKTKTGKKERSVSYRVITTIIFFASLSMCVYQTYELILLYLSDPIETQMKVVMHDAMRFPAVTICNLNPVRRSRWQKKKDKNESSEPKVSPWRQISRSKNLIRKARGFKTDSTAEHIEKMTPENYPKDLEDYMRSYRRGLGELKRTKRQSMFSGYGQIRQDIDDLKERMDKVEMSINDLANSTTQNFSNTAVNVSALWTSLNYSRDQQNELEKKVDDLEKRLSVTELTTAEIAEEMAKTRSYLDHLKANMSKTVEKAPNDTVVKETTEDGEEKLPPSKDLEAFQNYLKDIGEITREDFQELGNQKEDFIASCTWQGTICDSGHFEVFQNFMYGNCFTFNTSKVGSYVSTTGPYNGLSLSLFIEQDEYIDRIASAAGARVVVHESHFKPLPDEEGFSVAPGYTTAISLQKWTTETVKPICDPDIETSVRNGEKYQYSQKGCLKKCLSDEIIRQCLCAGTQFLLDMKTCSVDNETEVKCVEELESLARKNKLPCYCPLPCRTTAYNPIISSAVWPAEKYLPSLLEELVRVRHRVLDMFENITDFGQYFRKNFLRINIYFQELKEQETLQRHSYGIASLLSDIGGQLGLWVGVSVLTLVDFTETTSMLAMTLYRRIKTKLLTKSRRLSTTGGVRPSIEVSAYAIDPKGSCILSPRPSRSGSLRPGSSLVNTASGTSARFSHVHVHFEDSSSTSINK